MSVLPTVIKITGNGTIFICQEMGRLKTGSLWHGGNPLKVPYSLFLLQVSVISLVTQLFDLLLKHVGQSTMISQILGGVMFGPSMLGHIKVFAENLFPLGSTITLKVTAIFGLMFSLFTIAVKMDPSMIFRPGRKAMAIGISIFFFGSTLTVGLAFLLIKVLPEESRIADSVLYLAATQTITGFPMVATLLTELKILNTDIGRVALSSAMVCDFISICLFVITFSVSISKEQSVLAMIWALLSAIALLATVVFILRPIMLWMVHNSAEDEPVHEKYIFTIFVFVLVTGVLAEVIGQHYAFGPLILGFVVPDGPPLGAALESKLETFVSRMLYPVFLAVSGLETNVFKIQLQSLWIMGIIVFFACIVKIGAVMLPAVYSNIPRQEAFVIGLIMNAKGIFEVIVFNLLRRGEVLSEEDFALSILSILVVTGIISPLVKFLYDPSTRYTAIHRSTIQHSKLDTGLRILVCIHNKVSIPTIINILEVSHATENSPVAVTALILVELVGRSAPILVANELEGNLESNTSTTSCVANALRLYQHHNQDHATVQSFTSVCLFETMHDDVYRVARDKRSTIIIMPFHKQGAIDGTNNGTMNPAIKTLNLNVLQMAPCSVGILIDRGILTGSFCVLTGEFLFHVAAIFIGGQDDVESLAYASRMARHECVRLTVIRFLLFGAENTKDRKRDSDWINEYRRNNMGKKNFQYSEETVRDGAGLAASLIGLADEFDLILVGKTHQESQIFAGLEAWNECPEVGVVGDMLASPDFGRRASILVVQQQRVGGKMMHRNVQPVVSDSHRDREPVIHDVPHNEASRLENNYSLSISVDKS